MQSESYRRVFLVSFSVVPAPDRHGVQVHNLIKALAPRYTVDVMTLRAGDLGYVEKYHKTRMLRVPVGDSPLLEQVRTFRRAVRRQVEGNDYDVIHFRSAFGGLPVCELRDYLDAKLIFELAISPRAQPRPANADLAADILEAERLCLEKADQIVVHSQSARQYLLREGIERDAAVVPQGADVDLFDWEEAPASADPQVLCISRLGPGRGIRTLIRAFKEVLSHTSARLILVGRVEERFDHTLQESIRKLGLTGAVQILGPVEHEDLPRLIALAQICVTPACPDLDRQPVAGLQPQVLEYMACRKPVIAPLSPLMHEVAGASGCFTFFHHGSAGDMATAITRMIQKPELGEKLAEAAYRRVRESFTASGSRRQMLSMYRKLLPESEVLAGRPGLDAVPGVMEADPQTTTARRFQQFHDTATHPGPPGSITVTPTSKARSETHSDTWELVLPDLNEDSEITGEIEAREGGGVEIDETDFVAAGELLPQDPETEGKEEGTRPDIPGKPG